MFCRPEYDDLMDGLFSERFLIYADFFWPDEYLNLCIKTFVLPSFRLNVQSLGERVEYLGQDHALLLLQAKR